MKQHPTTCISCFLFLILTFLTHTLSIPEDELLGVALQARTPAGKSRKKSETGTAAPFRQRSSARLRGSSPPGGQRSSARLRGSPPRVYPNGPTKRKQPKSPVSSDYKRPAQRQRQDSEQRQHSPQVQNRERIQVQTQAPQRAQGPSNRRNANTAKQSILHGLPDVVQTQWKARNQNRFINAHEQPIIIRKPETRLQLAPPPTTDPPQMQLRSQKNPPRFPLDGKPVNAHKILPSTVQLPRSASQQQSSNVPPPRAQQRPVITSPIAQQQSSKEPRPGAQQRLVITSPTAQQQSNMPPTVIQPKSKESRPEARQQPDVPLPLSLQPSYVAGLRLSLPLTNRQQHVLSRPAHVDLNPTRYRLQELPPTLNQDRAASLAPLPPLKHIASESVSPSSTSKNDEKGVKRAKGGKVRRPKPVKQPKLPDNPLHRESIGGRKIIIFGHIFTQGSGGKMHDPIQRSASGGSSSPGLDTHQSQIPSFLRDGGSARLTGNLLQRYSWEDRSVPSLGNNPVQGHASSTMQDHRLPPLGSHTQMEMLGGANLHLGSPTGALNVYPDYLQRQAAQGLTAAANPLTRDWSHGNLLGPSDIRDIGGQERNPPQRRYSGDSWNNLPALTSMPAVPSLPSMLGLETLFHSPISPHFPLLVSGVGERQRGGQSALDLVHTQDDRFERADSWESIPGQKPFPTRTEFLPSSSRDSSPSRESDRNSRPR